MVFAVPGIKKQQKQFSESVFVAGAGIKNKQNQPPTMVFAVPGIDKKNHFLKVVFAGAGVKTNKKQPREMVFAVPGIKKKTHLKVFVVGAGFKKKQTKNSLRQRFLLFLASKGNETLTRWILRDWGVKVCFIRINQKTFLCVFVCICVFICVSYLYRCWCLYLYIVLWK
jgi:hypothetical protein